MRRLVLVTHTGSIGGIPMTEHRTPTTSDLVEHVGRGGLDALRELQVATERAIDAAAEHALRNEAQVEQTRSDLTRLRSPTDLVVSSWLRNMQETLPPEPGEVLRDVEADLSREDDGRIDEEDVQGEIERAADEREWVRERGVRAGRGL